MWINSNGNVYFGDCAQGDREATVEEVAAWESSRQAHLTMEQERASAIAENAENATIKYLTTHTAAQIATYVQNNVTDLASAKVVIARLAIAVGAMLR